MFYWGNPTYAGLVGSVLAKEGRISNVSDFFSGAFKVILALAIDLVENPWSVDSMTNLLKHFCLLFSLPLLTGRLFWSNLDKMIQPLRVPNPEMILWCNRFGVDTLCDKMIALFSCILERSFSYFRFSVCVCFFNLVL